MGQSGKAEMYDAAAAAFDTVIDEISRRASTFAQALFNRGECFYRRGKKQEAAAMYAQLLAKFPGDKLAADALYALGVSQEELGQQAEAGKSYDLFLEKYPQNPLAAEVTVRRGETLFAPGAVSSRPPNASRRPRPSRTSPWPTMPRCGRRPRWRS